MMHSASWMDFYCPLHTDTRTTMEHCGPTPNTDLWGQPACLMWTNKLNPGFHSFSVVKLKSVFFWSHQTKFSLGSHRKNTACLLYLKEIANHHIYLSLISYVKTVVLCSWKWANKLMRTLILSWLSKHELFSSLWYWQPGLTINRQHLKILSYFLFKMCKQALTGTTTATISTKTLATTQT